MDNKNLFTLNKISLPEVILEKLESPKSAYDLAKELPFKPEWLYQNLRKLVAEGKVSVQKTSDITKPHSYEIINH